jgi:hypothetical protein
VIHRKAKVDAVADQHQAVETVVTIALFIWNHSVTSHVLHCLLAAQLPEDLLVQICSNTTCGSVNEQITMM